MLLPGSLLHTGWECAAPAGMWFMCMQWSCMVGILQVVHGRLPWCNSNCILWPVGWIFYILYLCIKYNTSNASMVYVSICARANAKEGCRIAVGKYIILQTCLIWVFYGMLWRLQAALWMLRSRSKALCTVINNLRKVIAWVVLEVAADSTKSY